MVKTTALIEQPRLGCWVVIIIMSWKNYRLKVKLKKKDKREDPVGISCI